MTVSGSKISSRRVRLLTDCQFNSIAEPSELSDHSPSARLFALLGHCGAVFFVTSTFMEELPNETTLPVRNDSDSLFVPEARYRTTIDDLEDSSFGSLMKKAPHVTVTLRI